MWERQGNKVEVGTIGKILQSSKWEMVVPESRMVECRCKKVNKFKICFGGRVVPGCWEGDQDGLEGDAQFFSMGN